MRVVGGERVQGVVGAGQPAGQREQQHRDVADVVHVRPELGRVRRPALLGDLEGDVGAEQVVRVALLGDAGLLVREDQELLAEALDEFLLGGEI